MATTRNKPTETPTTPPSDLDVFETPIEAPTEAASPAVQAAQTRLLDIEEEINSRVIDRRNVVRGALVALIAGQHMVILGPPGEAKSALVDAVRGRVVGATGFKLLMTRFTTPEEVFGPISITGLKQDRYARMTEGYFSQAHIPFLDEPFKAGSSILNTLLMALNERQFRNDGAITDIPLISMFGASNEMPQGEDLGALWDRISLRYWIDPLGGSSLRRFMGIKRDLAAHGQTGLGSLESTITLDELYLLQQRALELQGSLSDRVFSLYEDIIREIHAKGLKVPSTRRTGWCLQLIAANAVLAGRNRANESDLAILGNVLWEDPKSAREVNALVIKMANPRLAEAEEKYDAVLQVAAQVQELWKKQEGNRSEKNAKVIEGRGKIVELGQAILALQKAAEKDGADQAELNQFKAILTQSKQAFKDVADLLGNDPVANWA